jgi:hypothetical protein
MLSLSWSLPLEWEGHLAQGETVWTHFARGLYKKNMKIFVLFHGVKRFIVTLAQKEM